MTALRKHSASASELLPVDAAVSAPREASPDSFAYDDDVTTEGIAAVRDRAAELRPARKYKVIDGYVGDRASAVG